MKRPFAAIFLSLVLFAAAAYGQSLTVQPETGNPVVLSRADLDALPHEKVTVKDKSSNDASYDGVALRAVLEKAGVGFGESLKGKRLSTCLLVEATDGYKAVIALPELDPAFNQKEFLLAFSRDGKALDDKEGPYRIVIPEEKRMARWVRQVTKLKIVEVQ